jgi:hypothetical protein
MGGILRSSHYQEERLLAMAGGEDGLVMKKKSGTPFLDDFAVNSPRILLIKGI